MSPFKSEPKALPYGPVMIDIVGLELTDHDRERLCHPLVGGLILFARNYQSPEQLQRLTAEVHALRTPQLPCSVSAIARTSGRPMPVPPAARVRARSVR